MLDTSKLSGLELLASLSEEQQEEFYRSLSQSELAGINWNWRGFIARPNQLPPGTEGAADPREEWTHWMVQAGRGFGKTRIGAETVREWATEKLEAPIHLVAPTAGDIRKVMIEGPSGLLACHPPEERPVYEPSKGHLITWANGNHAYCFSADEPDRLRGPQCCRLWADELASWHYAEECWDNLMFGFRIGNNLRSVITTTPRPIKLIRDLISDPATVVTRGSTYDNKLNLAKEFFNTVIRKYEGTRLGRQELLAEILEDVPGALWSRAMIEAGRIPPESIRWDMIVRIVVAIDPAVTSSETSDETGIVVAGLTRSGHVVVMQDLSCRESPLGWARVAVAAYHAKQANMIVGEVNNGGDLVAGNIRAIGPGVPFRAVRASRGKYVRAEPVAALYEQGRVHHAGAFERLEDQMCGWSPQSNESSPDRMDALVWAVTELLIDTQELTMRTVTSGEYQISPI